MLSPYLPTTLRDDHQRSIMTEAPLTPDQDALFQHYAREFEGAPDVATLRRAVARMIGELMRRQNELEFKLRAAKLVGNYFDVLSHDHDALRKLRHFAVRVVRTLLVIRARVALARAAGAEEQMTAFGRRLSDLPGPDVVERPTPIVVIWPPPPSTHPGFEQVFAAAVKRRLRLITTFFQRHNPEAERNVPQPFLQSPRFGAALEEVVDRFILPSMMRSRGVRTLQLRQHWHDIDEEAFWRLMEQDISKQIILAAWETAWHVYRQEVVFLRDAEALGWKAIYKATPEFEAMEKALVRPDYFIPQLTNREIDLFTSLLEPVYGRPALENAWTRLRQFYEQELDRRSYQEQARDGALRDTLLDCFNFFPDRIGELLALLCYFNFPRLTITYLEAFTRTKGKSLEERQRRIPYLMLFLDDEQVKHAKLVEEVAAAEVAEAEAKAKAEAEPVATTPTASPPAVDSPAPAAAR